jgi:hypothetical protein
LCLLRVLSVGSHCVCSVYYQLGPILSAPCFISWVPRCLLHVYHLGPKMSASCVAVGSQDICFIFISWVPICLLHIYQLGPNSLLHAYHLGPNMSASCVSVWSQCVCFTCISWIPRCLLHVLSFGAQCVCFMCIAQRQDQTPESLPFQTAQEASSQGQSALQIQ